MRPQFAELTPRWFTRAFVYTSSNGDFSYRFDMGKEKGILHTAVYSVYCYEVAQDRQERDFPWDEAGVEELKQWLERLKREEALDPARYRNSGMLLRLPNGLAVEPVLIRKKFLKWQDAHPEFPRIVFHGLRHSSATYQLMISGGDIKAVQGTTGHASADMLVNTYAHIQQSSRVELGRKFEEGFYAKQESPSPQAVPAAGEPTISMTALLELLKNADPEVKAQLRLALLT